MIEYAIAYGLSMGMGAWACNTMPVVFMVFVNIGSGKGAQMKRSNGICRPTPKLPVIHVSIHVLYSKLIITYTYLQIKLVI